MLHVLNTSLDHTSQDLRNILHIEAVVSALDLPED